MSKQKTNKRNENKGWTLVKRGNTYTVMHRYTLNGKQTGKSTGESDYESAMRVALDIVKEARSNSHTSEPITEVFKKKKDDIYYVKHRYTVDGKQVIVSTGETNEESATQVAKKIVTDAKEQCKVIPIRGSVMINAMKQMSTQIAEKKYAQEEEKFLGNELDKINPRLSVLWAFGENKDSDSGLFHDSMKQRSTSVFKNRRPEIKTFFDFFTSQGVNRVNDITPEILSDCYDECIFNYTNTETQHHRDISMRMFFNFLNKTYKIALPEYPKVSNVPNPLKAIDSSNVLTTPEITEIASFLSGRDNETYNKLFFIGLYTGCRKSEITNLLWSNVHFNTSRITITTNTPDADKGITKSYLKNRNAFRIVPISNLLMPLLKEWFENKSNSPYVLDSIRGDRNLFSTNYICLELQKIVKHMHMHILRHTFISNALLAGVPPIEVAKWVGDSLNVILSIYTHFLNTGNIDLVYQKKEETKVDTTD